MTATSLKQALKHMRRPVIEVMNQRTWREAPMVRRIQYFAKDLTRNSMRGNQQAQMNMVRGRRLTKTS